MSGVPVDGVGLGAAVVGKVDMPFIRPRLSGLAPLALLTALALAPCPAVAQEGEPAASERLPAVTVATAAAREFVQRVPVSGTIIPREEVLVYPKTDGAAVTALSVDIGERVVAGQVLARIDDRALRSQLAQAKAERAHDAAAGRQAESEVASAEATQMQASQALDRAQRLRGSGTGSQATLEDATAAERTAVATAQSARDGVALADAQVQQAQAALDLARLNLGYAEVTAPVDGIVSARNGQVGSIASAGGEPIFRIIRDGVVEVEAEVIETELALLAAGDPADLAIAGLPRVTGTVRRISPVVDPVTRLGTIRIALDGPEGVRPGLFAGGWVVTERRQGLAIPATAVIAEADETYVLRVTESVLERRAVTTGLMWQGWREIVAGLAAGDRVVARAGAFFGDGDVIRPIEASVEEGAGTAAAPIKPPTQGGDGEPQAAPGTEGSP